MTVKTEIFNNIPRIVADDLIAFDPNGGLRGWSNSITGGFTEPRGEKPCSILINRGVDTFSYSCHNWLGFPEAVIYRYRDGRFGMGKFKSTGQIPNRRDILWAVGGMGLLDNYNPKEEGFCKGIRPDGKPFDFTDVLRDTDHNVLGIKNYRVYLMLFPSMSAIEVNTYMESCEFDMAIILDGGGLGAINGSIPEAKVNMDVRQGYGLQGMNANFVVPVVENKEPLVIFDAGHNALNRSNRSPDGKYVEADSNLDMVNLIMPHLNRCEIRTKFVESINSSQTDELNDLVKQIDDSNGDVMVSIHTDASSNLTVKGQTIYCYKLKGEGMKLSQAIHDSTVPLSGMYDRGIKDGSKSIKVIFGPVMPCVLIECGFHTNADDLTRLKSKEWRDKMAMLIAKGIVSYFKKEWVEPIVDVCPTCGRPM